jgi:hypothetical protein
MIVEQPQGAMRASDPDELLMSAQPSNSGTREWCDWKIAATKEVIDLVKKAPRLKLVALDLAAELRMAFEIRMPIPRWPVDHQIVVGNIALFDLTYQESWRWQSPPSFEPLGLLHPPDVFHPNCAPSLTPVLVRGLGLVPIPRVMVCLGRLPPGIPPKQILLMGYAALTLQDFVLDELDPNGVFNPESCAYYRDHPQYLPLTRAGLLEPWEQGTSK